MGMLQRGARPRSDMKSAPVYPSRSVKGVTTYISLGVIGVANLCGAQAPRATLVSEGAKCSASVEDSQDSTPAGPPLGCAMDSIEEYEALQRDQLSILLYLEYETSFFTLPQLCVFHTH